LDIQVSPAHDGPGPAEEYARRLADRRVAVQQLDVVDARTAGARLLTVVGVAATAVFVWRGSITGYLLLVLPAGTYDVHVAQPGRPDVTLSAMELPPDRTRMKLIQ